MMVMTSNSTLIAQTSENFENAEVVNIEGRVFNHENQSPLHGATIYILELERGTITDRDGYYELKLPKGEYTVRVQFLGFKTLKRGLNANKSKKIDFHLKPEPQTLDEITVEHHGALDLVTGSTAGVEVITLTELEEIPVLMGELDVVNTLTSLPGVQKIGEGSSGFNVRGGSVDQNLVLMEGSPIINPSHVLGLYSVFNPDATEKFTLFKGHIPARFGGRLSSVLDVDMKEGSVYDHTLKAGVSLYSARLTIDGPLQREKTSYLVSVRGATESIAFGLAGKNRDLASLPIRQTIFNSSAWFYDSFGSVNHRFNPRNNVSLSVYRSEDYFRYTDDFGYSWDNRIGRLKWESAFSERVHSFLDASISIYNAEYFTPSGPGNFALSNGIRTSKFSYRVRYLGFDGLTLEAGAEWNRYRNSDEILRPFNNSSAVQKHELGKNHGEELSFYVDTSVNLSESLLLSTGGRYTRYYQIAPYRSFSGDSVNGVVPYAYSGFEPRSSLRILLNPQSSLKFSYSKTSQFIHQLSNTSSPTPADAWFVSTSDIKPQIANNLSVGYYYRFKNRSIDVSLESYYRFMQNITELRDFTNLFMNSRINEDLLSGNGRAYGLELSIEKEKGKWKGWVSYTYGRTFIRVHDREDSINSDDWFPANYDQPQQLHITGIRDIGEESAFSFQFVWRSGRPITAIASNYIDDKTVVPAYSERNRYRIPDYIRLDISFTIAENIWKNRSPNPYRKIKDSVNITLYNVLGRENAFSVFYRRPENENLPQSYKLSVLGAVIPSLTYNIQF
jgi:hypothetical protein